MHRFVDDKKDISFTFNDKTYKAKEGDSISVALFSNNILINRKTYNNTSRGSFCFMGVCFECLVSIDGKSGIQSCKMKLIDGMEIKDNE
jgi:predicted molibdopterin-dependent oxidoreductase YjgC